MEHLSESEIKQRLETALEQQDPEPTLELPNWREFATGEPRPAAVLIPLLQLDSSWHILFTRRNADLPEHSGQVAFPGGRADPGDKSPEETALRETYEEIGVKPEHVRILGRLHDYITVTNYFVTPIVGVIPWPYPLIPAANEVTRIFTIPLSWLVDPSHHEVRQRQLPPPIPSVQVVYFNSYDDEVLWGASARFTLALLRALNLI